MKSRRAYMVAPRNIELREVDVINGPDEVLVKVEVCGLCNWELNHWKGHINDYPLTVGHECGGVVIAVGENVTNFKEGDLVTALLPNMDGFSDYVAFHKTKCVKLSPEVNPIHTFGEPLKCIVTVVRAAAPECGDYGLIMGCGAMGLWCIQALSGNLLSGLIAVDIDDEKLNLAKEFGAAYTINPLKQDVVSTVAEITGGHMVDFAIDGTGSPKTVNTSMQSLRKGKGRLVLMSSYESEAAFDYQAAMEKSIEVRVAHGLYSNDEMDDMRRAAACLNNGTFAMDKLISHTFKLENIQQAFETLEQKPQGFLKGIVIPGELK